jgi:two-component system phosphate regulon sensor histidine kinase PhoR
MSAAPGTLSRATLRAAAARHQRRLKRAVAQLQPIAARIVDRRVELGLFAAVMLALVVLASLSLKAALVSFGVALVWAGLWSRQGSRSAAASELGTQSIGEQALWRVAIDAVPVPIVVLDGAGNLMHANAMAAELFGSRRLAGHIASVSRAPELLDAVDAALANNETRLVELQERIPLERRLMVTVAPLGGVRAYADHPALLIAFRDLSDQDRLARMRADFVANASHELRTPLASLKGFVETLQGPAKDDPAARERFLKVMSEQAGRMTRLIDDLLSLSRVEMREHLPLGSVVDLNDVLAHVVQSLQPLAAESSTSVDLQKTEHPAEVRGDRDELVQVFQNLIHNAIKYGRQGGRVEITLARQPAAQGRPAQIVVAVSDDGPGIAPQHLPRLTERFYRVSVAASREKGGTGLGLAIVKHILNRHRGELTISSTIGQGSTFFVALPAARA